MVGTIPDERIEIKKCEIVVQLWPSLQKGVL